MNNHTRSYHTVKTWDNQTCKVNSLHHQMVYPWDLPKEDYKLLQWSESISDTYLDGWGYEINLHNDAITEHYTIIEPEAIFYPKTKSLGVQYHPEMLDYRGWDWNLEGNMSDVHTLDYLNSLTKILFYEPNYFNRVAKEQLRKERKDCFTDYFEITHQEFTRRHEEAINNLKMYQNV